MPLQLMGMTKAPVFSASCTVPSLTRRAGPLGPSAVISTAAFSLRTLRAMCRKARAPPLEEEPRIGLHAEFLGHGRHQLAVAGQGDQRPGAAVLELVDHEQDMAVPENIDQGQVLLLQGGDVFPAADP